MAWLRPICMALLCTVGQAVCAQPLIQEDRIPSPWIEVIGDVNADGHEDRLRSTPLNQYTDIISIELGRAYGLSDTADMPDHIIAIPTNWSDFDSIERTSHSSFTISTGCFACGRYHSHIAYHIAYRNDHFVVAGYTKTAADRNYATVETCDVNLLTGKADIDFEDETQHHTIQDRSFMIEDLTPEYTPQICQKLDQFDDAFKESYIKAREAQ